MSAARTTRRNCLRALGACGVMLPWLRPRPVHAATAAPRLVLLMQSNGTGQSNFWPRTPDKLESPILAPITDDPVLRAKTTIIKGITNTVGGIGNGHDFGFSGLWSGYQSVGTFNDPWGGGISIDQLLRKSLTFGEPFPSLHCGVLATDIPAFKTHRRSFSYSGPRRQIPTEVDVTKLYARFFPAGAVAGQTAGNDADAAAVVRRRLQQKKSVLDFVTGDLRNLRTTVGKRDRERLDAHEAALRQLEQQLGSTLNPAARRPGRCVSVTAPPVGLDPGAEDNVPQLVRLMLDFVALTLTCQLTRIVTFQFGNGGEKWFYRWLGINENSHDDIAHRDTGMDPTITAKILKINVWHAEQVAYLARALDRIPEGDGTALDNTLIVWGNEIATGNHAMQDIPIVMLGKAAGRLKRTGYMVDGGAQDYHRLGTSVLNMMGVPAEGFGEVSDCGPVRGLEV